jgi:hypothetical protein
VQTLCTYALQLLISFPTIALRCGLVNVEVEPQFALSTLNDLRSLRWDLGQPGSRSEDYILKAAAAVSQPHSIHHLELVLQSFCLGIVLPAGELSCLIATLAGPEA